jgi:chemotaxis protein CheC
VDDVRDLKALQLDALREVANIGAGHAATALSQMTGHTIMISVPKLTISLLEDVPSLIADREEPVAAVLMRMHGDLTGFTLLVFPKATAVKLAGLMLARAGVSELGELEQSALKEAGNILTAAYLNALSEFLRMVLLPSPPSLAIDLSGAVLSSAYVEIAQGAEYVFCVESEFHLTELGEHLRGFFLLLPDVVSLTAILRAIRVA